MIKYDTYVCDTCKKALDIAVNPSGITALPRCKITKNCTGLMTKMASTAANGQYHNATSVDTWFQRPLIHDHIQESPRKLWTVNHGLGANAIFQVVVPDSSGTLVPLHDFNVMSGNDKTAVLEFSSAYAGRALCTARQSTTVTPITPAVELPAIPLSINNTMVIATRVRTASSIELSVQPNPLRPSDIVHLDVTISPPVNTPWSGASYVIISNQRYFVRYVNISDVLLFHRAAATFFVNLFNEAAVVRGDTFVLLSDDPYTHQSDRKLTAAVDLVDLAITKQSNTLLTQDALLCTSDAVSTIYPIMKVA